MLTLTSQAWCFLPLFAAVIFALVRQSVWQNICLLLTCFLALFTNIINWYGCFYIALGLAFALYFRPYFDKQNNILGLVLMLWCMPLLLHQTIGVTNIKVLVNVFTGEQSQAFNMFLNFDKPWVFFALLFAYPSILGNKANPNWFAVLSLSVPLTGLLVIAWLLGAIKPELSLPSWLWLFVLNNLLITCVTEEALFRGYLQQMLTNKFGIKLGLIIASILFGLAHFAGGALLIAFATIAGVIYGLAFYWSNRLWVAITTHFLFNFMHLIFFTYPAAKN